MLAPQRIDRVRERLVAGDRGLSWHGAPVGASPPCKDYLGDPSATSLSPPATVDGTSLRLGLPAGLGISRMAGLEPLHTMVRSWSGRCDISAGGYTGGSPSYWR